MTFSKETNSILKAFCFSPTQDDPSSAQTSWPILTQGQPVLISLSSQVRSACTNLFIKLARVLKLAQPILHFIDGLGVLSTICGPAQAHNCISNSRYILQISQTSGYFLLIILFVKFRDCLDLALVFHNVYLD